jgi:hypothetical protein
MDEREHGADVPWFPQPIQTPAAIPYETAPSAEGSDDDASAGPALHDLILSVG